MKRIVLVEDNPDWLDLCESQLETEFPHYKVLVIGTEFEFAEKIPELEKQLPSLFIIDVMLPWTEPDSAMPEPGQFVKDDGFFKAGLRCQQLLAENRRLQNVPIIFWTILSETDLKKELIPWPQSVAYIAKDADLKPLLRKMRELLHEY